MLMKTLKGCAVGFAVMIVLMVVLALVITYTSFSYEMSGIGSMVCMIIGMFAGGFVASLGCPGKGWLRGIICGGAMLCVLIIFGLILNGSAIIQPGLFKGIIAAVTASVAGGIFGINIRV